LELTGVSTQLFREAREGKRGLFALWLDLANGCGSTPNLTVLALQRHVSRRITDLILDYYSKFRLRATTGLGTDWLEKGRLHHLSDSLRSRYEHDCEVRKVQRPFDEIWSVTDPNISLHG